MILNMFLLKELQIFFFFLLLCCIVLCCLFLIHPCCVWCLFWEVKKIFKNVNKKKKRTTDKPQGQPWYLGSFRIHPIIGSPAPFISPPPHFSILKQTFGSTDEKHLPLTLTFSFCNGCRSSCSAPTEARLLVFKGQASAGLSDHNGTFN